MKRVLGVASVLLAAAGVVSAQDRSAPLLLQEPAVSKDLICFVFAGDLWTVPRGGGDARRLTVGPGSERTPHFSPDGKQIAFTGEYDGNVDVYVVPAEGGVPQRVTYHPLADRLAGWHPDGKRVLFASYRHSYSGFTRLFTAPVDGTHAEEVPLPMAEEGSYSADGKHLAYVPLRRSFSSWKRYRGGTATPVWLADLSDSSIQKLPRTDSNDFEPMWVGEKVYFLSDRDGPVTLYSYDTKSKKVAKAIKNDGLDIKSASAGPGAIAYEQFGRLHLYDLKSGDTKPVEVRLTGDLPEVRPRFEKVRDEIRGFSISPTGVRVVVEAHGEILTVPTDKGDPRNLTETPGAAERDPTWSPDGKWIAYFSDEGGEYQLHLKDQTGRRELRKLALDDAPSYFYGPTWSPDSKKLAYTDRRLNLCYLDIETGKRTKVDTNTYDDWGMMQTWSPDSKWLAYVKLLKSGMGAVFVHSLADGTSRQITDGMSDAAFPTWDRGGKYLYFAGSTDIGPTLGFIDMSSRFNRPYTRSIYVAVLRNDEPSPLAPESDEEKVTETPAEPKPGAETEIAVRKAADGGDGAVRIDFENLDQRILALPIVPRAYSAMQAGKPGVLFIAESAPVGAVGVNGRTLHRFDLKTRKTDRFLDGIVGFEISHNREKLLYLTPGGGRAAVVSTAQPPSPGAGTVNLESLEVRVDPRAEWRQMYREVWRIQRDFFYDPNHHGLDLKATSARYEPYLENLATRADLNYLFREMLGELTVGHLYVSGGATPEVQRVPGGLLGADYTVENGRYRFSRIYEGENWDPQLRAPLTQPGVNVKVGEYLLAVNGRDLSGSDNLYRHFEGSANKQVSLRVGPNADGTGSREVTVVPIASEVALRNRSWIESNRRKVNELSGGKLAYIYLPDTGLGGYTAFNKYFFPQADKDGAVVDERFNGGGAAADYIIDYLRRPLLSVWSSRYGEDVTTPGSLIRGPKAMLINEYAGSGGDAMPWYFRKLKVGPLIGKRTWGGLVGIGGYPTLIDGGSVTAPHFAFWNPEGSWEVENVGVAPDIEVEFDPQAWRQGRDPQLEKAIQVVMEDLRKNPVTQPKRPAYPNYHQRR
ncbi:MAG: PDZ domain-containing protein [Armatimonadota bacterium]